MAVARIAPNDLRYRSRNGSAARSAKPKISGRLRRWLWTWFKYESPVLTALNALISLGILALTTLMTPLGGERVHWPQSTTLEAYAGGALLAVAALKAIRVRSARRHKLVRRIIGYANAGLFALMGSWLLAVWFYESRMLWLFKPGIMTAEGSLPADLNYFDASVVPLLAPALAVLVGLVFSLRQLKSLGRAIRERRRKALALAGLLASACIFSIGAYAADYRAFGDLWYDMGGAPSARDAAGGDSYGPLFAAGIPCHVSDGFGVRENPFDRRMREFHPGVDLAVAEGTPIRAMASGTVVFSGDNYGFGNMVAIRADDGSTNPQTLVAAHMQRLFVATGDSVQRGDVIGEAGSTGRSTGPHVHLQVCLDGHTTRAGRFVCGMAQNPYESWRTLSAIARSSCTHGPIV